MNQSKAGKKLNPIISDVATPIFEEDPMRYQRLVVWIWRAQKDGWPDEAIAEALKMAQPAIHGVGNWWAYLTKLLPKAKGRATEDESATHKSADMALAGDIVEFLKQRMGKR